MSLSRPAGVGLVGAGGFGAFCAEAYDDLEEVQIVAVADLELARARDVAPQGAAVYTDYQELLTNLDVDIVAVNTPPFLHARIAQQAAEAGKHVFVEKPLATSMPAARGVLDAVEQSGVHITVDYVLRHHPLHRLAAAVTHSHILGPLQHWALTNFATDEGLPPDHWFWDLERSGGIHVEHGVHFFDLCDFFVGQRPTEVYGAGQQRTDGRIDRVSALVCYGEDVTATFYHAFNQIRRFERTTIDLNCVHGRLIVEGWIPTKLQLRGWVDDEGLDHLERLLDAPVHVVEQLDGDQGIFEHGGNVDRLKAVVEAEVTQPDRQGTYRHAVQAGMRDLVEAVREDRQPAVTGEDGLISLQTALAASVPFSRTTGDP